MKNLIKKWFVLSKEVGVFLIQQLCFILAPEIKIVVTYE